MHSDSYISIDTSKQAFGARPPRRADYDDADFTDDDEDDSRPGKRPRNSIARQVRFAALSVSCSC